MQYRSSGKRAGARFRSITKRALAVRPGSFCFMLYRRRCDFPGLNALKTGQTGAEVMHREEPGLGAF